MRAATMLLFASALLAGDGKKSGHPHFDDAGTLRWFTSLDDACAAAKKENKVVLVEYGREA